MTIVQKGHNVLFHFKSYLDDGSCVDGDSPEPLRMVAGSTSSAGSPFSKRIASSLIGMRVNETKRFDVPARFGFGERDTKKIYKMSLEIGDNYRLGDEIEIRVRTGNKQETLQGEIIDISKDYATVDTNHPLAGENLTVKIQVISFD